jgi:hypothetical protein
LTQCVQPPDGTGRDETRRMVRSRLGARRGPRGEYPNSRNSRRRRVPGSVRVGGDCSDGGHIWIRAGQLATMRLEWGGPTRWWRCNRSSSRFSHDLARQCPGGFLQIPGWTPPGRRKGERRLAPSADRSSMQTRAVGAHERAGRNLTPPRVVSIKHRRR